jgi:SAM-dependent methyltransferase
MSEGVPRRPPDWQMPPGVQGGLWDYLQSEDLAAGYDAGLQDSALASQDVAFVDRHCPTPGRLLDLGCGTGRLLAAMARKGHSPVGIDLSLPMLQVAREKTQALGLSVDLVQANIIRLDFLADDSFDSAACLFSTLGMVHGADNRRAVVGHVYRLLRPGGTFILHVHNKWFNFWDRGGRRWLVRDLLAWRQQGEERGDRVMPVHQGIAGLCLHLFTRSEVVGLLRSAGFRIAEVVPVSVRADGRVRFPWWFGWLRAYGYLIAAKKEQAASAIGSA